MDEGIIAYILHEALMVSHVPLKVEAVRSTFTHLRPTSLESHESNSFSLSRFLSGPPAPSRQQDHPPRRQGQQHPADDARGGQTGGFW